ncbi:Adenylate cyclase [Hirsutella minnesotensis 3608]|uniref:Adenylate cyclase n=1 Tax=Hirsutella minnesotensis 3608 TaxID=1043627 RepID=A0A0F7ZVG8_9HYPO|nr:Adenylate cyclase [Hirsutella minnesotensis 3608]
MDNETAAARFSSLTSASTSTDGSTRSSVTAKPSTPSSNRRRGNSQMRIDVDSSPSRRPRISHDDAQVSPTSATGPRGALSPSSTSSSFSIPDRRASDLNNYRRDLSVLENSRNHSGAGSNSNIAPWASSNGPPPPPPKGPTTSFYDDSSDSVSNNSQFSPSYNSAGHRHGNVPTSIPESPDIAYFPTDTRRPSLASITTTASSQGSRASGPRGGFRKLQGFFGEEFPGRDSSESSLPASNPGKDQRSRSYSHTRPSQRDRNYSSATDPRDASPSSSRPRTPKPEVVPFLYQDNSDIARYGEAPVRDMITGIERERYENSANGPTKPSSSSRTGHGMHLPGQHRHNRSSEEQRSLRPSTSREDSYIGTAHSRDRGHSGVMHSQRTRANSPAPSSHHGSRSGHGDGPTSPVHPGKRGLLGRLRRHKDKDKDKDRDKEDANVARLRDLPPSTRTLQSKTSKSDFARRDMPPPQTSGHRPSNAESHESQDSRGSGNRGAPFNNKFPFAKKNRGHRNAEPSDEPIGPTDRERKGGNVYHLDTNLSDMEGILSGGVSLVGPETHAPRNAEDERKDSAVEQPKGGWDAPDSWAVRRGTEDSTNQMSDSEEAEFDPPRPEEKLAPYFIRIFRSDGTFSTHSMPLDATVSDLISQVVKKTYVSDGLENYHIILKKHDLIRVLTASERPLLLQKRLLQQVGYEEKDRIEELGREDNGYLCRFMFLSARESDFHAKTTDLGVSRTQKLNYVDLSARNLVTIPISLYSKASEIVSLNLSRNLSLDVPRDFIQSCKHLRDIKFTNNEARKLPVSLSRAGKLTYLDVSNNRVDHLEHNELHNLTGLLKMNLANNRLSHLPQYFDAYKSLRSLNISSNFLDTFPPFLCQLQSLVDLDLSFNTIARLPDEIGNLKNLEKLLITNNRLSDEVPETFRQLTNLRELDVKYNTMTSINIISRLPKLELLSASHNNVSSFEGKFHRIRQLKLNANPLNKFEIIEPAPTLKTLNLSHAQLVSIDSCFDNMMNLERLVLDNNHFVTIPTQIGTLSRLEHFSLANNSVAELPPTMGCLGELRILNIRGNNIAQLPAEIWWANRLETLNASSNVLEVFPKPATKPPKAPGGEEQSGPPPAQNGKPLPPNPLSATPSSEELTEERRPSQGSSTLLSVGPSPISADRKGSVVSVFGKGGRKTSVVSRAASSQGGSANAPPPSNSRKDSGVSSRLTSTFGGSLRHLYLADNRLDDEVFETITLCSELRVLNLSYNDEISDMPQRSMKSWPQLVELYLSGNGLTTVPADDLEESSLLQALYINGNRFTNLPADISRAKKLAVLDCGNNFLKYNISNVPYDWNWNLNPNLRYLNLSGNKRLEIKQTGHGNMDGPGSANREQYTDFNRLNNLRVLGLMDVTLTQPSIPDQSEDRRVRTSGSLAGHLPYGMADTLGKNEHLSTVDLVVPRFNSSETEMLLGLFDGQALSSGGSKVAKYLHENFGHIFAMELKGLKTRQNETPADALRRAFLALNKDLVTIAVQHTEERPKTSHRGTAQPVVLSREDLNSGGVATVVYLQGTDLYVANVGDAQAMVIQTDGNHQMLTQKHDPAEASERARIREAGGWVSRHGRLNDLLQVSRAFGYVDLMPAVQAAPHVSNMTVGDHEDIILMATSELWEYLTPGLITDIARAERQDLMRAAQKLRDLAMAYGASGKIMVMMISVADLKRRVERSRLHRGTSMSLYPSGVPDEALLPSTRRGRKAKGDVLDSSLGRLEAEIPAPTGTVSIVFTDIKNSTLLWEMYPSAMRSAIKLHNEVMRRQLRRIGGYEVKTEGDAFMVSFPTATSALLWCFSIQLQLLDVNWPSEILNSMSGQPVFDKDNGLIFKGLSVRMGIHFGDCVSELDPVTRRMDYFGPMVNKGARISAVADGGQITVSSDFISEIQRCLETFQDSERTGSVGTEDAFEDETFATAMRKDLTALTSQGFEVKEMGEKKLKGLENPEMIYSLYPHALAGRIEQHQQHERKDEGPEKPRTNSANGELSFDPENLWALWRVSLRLEMLCSNLEYETSEGLQAPETELLERMKARASEVTEGFLLNFAEHQVSRIEACATTLCMRHMAVGGGVLRELEDLRAPMDDVLQFFIQQKKELDMYRAKYGALPDHPETDEGEDGSDEQGDEDEATEKEGQDQEADEDEEEEEEDEDEEEEE